MTSVGLGVRTDHAVPSDWSVGPKNRLHSLRLAMNRGGSLWAFGSFDTAIPVGWCRTSSRYGVPTNAGIDLRSWHANGGHWFPVTTRRKVSWVKSLMTWICAGDTSSSLF